MTTKTASHLNAPEHDKVLAQIEADRAAGRDPLGDFDDDVGTTTASGAADAGTAEAGAGADGQDGTGAGADKGDGEQGGTAANEGAKEASGDAGQAASESGKGAEASDPSIEALQAIVGEDTKAVPLPTYNVPQDDFESRRKALKAQSRDVEKEWAAGNISDEERAAKLEELSDLRDALVRDETMAATVARLNQDGEQQSHQRILDNLAAASKAAGEIDYSTPENSAAFNAMLAATQSDPINAGKTYHEIALATHNAVCAVRGVQRATAPAPAPAPAASSGDATQEAASRKPPAAPVTLRDVPAASVPHTGGDWKDEMGRLSGQAWEEAFQRLPPARKAELLAE